MPLTPTRADFISLARSFAPRAGERPVIPLALRLMGDQLTPVLAYRRLVVRDERTAPSFLFESVESGERLGRYSIMGARPTIEVVARAHDVTIRSAAPGATASAVGRTDAPRATDSAAGPHHPGSPLPAFRFPLSAFPHSPDPLLLLRQLSSGMRLVMPQGHAARHLPSCPLGGWVGYASYDTVRYAEPAKLPFDHAPPDDRNLPDLHFGFYNRLVIFDHADTLVHIVQLVELAETEDPAHAYDRAAAEIADTADALQTHSKPLPSGLYEPESHPPAPLRSNLTREQHATIIERAKDYIRAGDIFQVVLGQRFERRSRADPFDVYRALRAVNPSPYMAYLQAEDCILIASSPEILCRVRAARATDCCSEQSVSSRPPLTVTNRPLAGTRRRGRTRDEDAELERELLADPKERAEHIMLVDLGRNDVGKVARPGSVRTPTLLAVERYSHVMHISSTVEGELAEGRDCWDALRAALPVGTISGAPKVRAMQIIDELEPLRRGPYGGGFGYVALTGEMDIALTLRTIIVPTAARDTTGWLYHLQAAGGIVADSRPDPEYQETVNKAAALARAIEMAESAFRA